MTCDPSVLVEDLYRGCGHPNLDLLTHELPLGAQHLLRSFIAPAGREVSGAFNVREQDGDGAFGKLLSHDGQPLLWTL